ncbi:MAG: potassium channel family protein [Bacteroidota bacterium]
MEKYKVVHSSIDEIQPRHEIGTFLDNLHAFLNKTDSNDIAMIYLLDERDENNLQMIISLISIFSDVPITAALFNENLIPHLENQHNNLTIFNPAKIAAPAFVAAIYQPLSRTLPPNPVKKNEHEPAKQKMSLTSKLLLGFGGIILGAITYFHFFEKLSWLDSIYFVVVTSATVGYSDINLYQSEPLSKIVGILLILSSTVFIWMIFSLTINGLLQRQAQLALGRKKYTMKDHIVICGLGRLGYFIAEELLRRNEKLIIIEQSEDSKHIDYFRQGGAEIYIGDGRLPKVLTDVNVAQARALISVINNDTINLEVGLNARLLKNDIRLILRIFDETMAGKIKDYLHIHLTLSASAIADDKFAEVLKKHPQD